MDKEMIHWVTEGRDWERLDLPFHEELDNYIYCGKTIQP